MLREEALEVLSEEGRGVDAHVVGPDLQPRLDPAEHDVVGDLAGVAPGQHVELGLFVEQLQHPVVLHTLIG